MKIRNEKYRNAHKSQISRRRSSSPVPSLCLSRMLPLHGRRTHHLSFALETFSRNGSKCSPYDYYTFMAHLVFLPFYFVTLGVFVLSFGELTLAAVLGVLLRLLAYFPHPHSSYRTFDERNPCVFVFFCNRNCFRSTERCLFSCAVEELRNQKNRRGRKIRVASCWACRD